MGRIAKAELLAGIRTKLNSMSFQHSGDRAMDIVSAGNAVLREARVDYHSGMLTPMIETLTAPEAQVKPVNSMSISFRGLRYSIPAPRTKTERAVKMPRWARSELDLRCFCQDFEDHMRFNPPVLSVTQNTYTYYVNGETQHTESRSLEVIARAQSDAAKNAAEKEACEARQRAVRAEMRRETAQVKPAVHAAKPSLTSVGFGRMVRAKWFLKSPPVMAKVTSGGVR